jgi:hypothetical protein
MPDVIDDLLESNAQARAEFVEAIDALSPAQRKEGFYGPERWSVHDIVAHIIGWQIGFTHGLELIAKGERPSIPGLEGDQFDPYNANSVESRRNLSWEQLMAELRATREQHEAAVRALRESVPPERLVPGKTAHNLGNLAGHDREHLEPILEWRRTQKI